MLGSTKLILLSDGAMSDHCFPLSESYQFPGFPVCKEERALGLLRPQLWPRPLVIKMLGELSKADTSLIASRLLYFYKNVHAVQSGCMDHKKLPSRNLHVVILAVVWGHSLDVDCVVVHVNNNVDVDVGDTAKIALSTHKHKHTSIKLLHFFARVENFII